MSDKFGLSRQVVQKISQVFERYQNIEKVLIYGSRALGTYKPGSDIDLVIFSKTMSLTELLKIEMELDDLLLPYSIDISIYRDIEDSGMLDHISRVGQIFYSS
jgi:predicted nucleotidyltransferase